jgi:hypothetical protein
MLEILFWGKAHVPPGLRRIPRNFFKTNLTLFSEAVAVVKFISPTTCG